MLKHQITTILTINASDFKRFTEIQAVHPSEMGEAT